MHKLYQNREEKSSGPQCFSMMEKSLGPAHYSRQFHNRDLAQWSGTSEVSARDRQLGSVAVAMNGQTPPWPRAMRNVRRSMQSAVSLVRSRRYQADLSLLRAQYLSGERCIVEFPLGEWGENKFIWLTEVNILIPIFTDAIWVYGPRTKLVGFYFNSEWRNEMI